LDEGLFEKEGITVEWADRETGVDKTPQLNVISRYRCGKSCNRSCSPG